MSRALIGLALFLSALDVSGHREELLFRVGFALAAAWTLWCLRADATKPVELAAWERWALVGVIGLFIAGNLVAIVVRPALGIHGIDYAIFSQAIDAIGREGVPWVTLISDGTPTNFLGHHFAPILYLAGALARFGVNASLAGVLVHGAGWVLLLVALHAAFRALGLSRGHALLLVVVATFAPAIRGPYGGSMNDELFGVPLLVAGVAVWLRGSYGQAAVLLLGSCLCKESFALVTVVFVAAALVWHAEFRPPEERRAAARALLPAAAIAFVVFVVYFFLQPVLLGKTFDHAAKLATFDQLLDGEALRDKAVYLATLLIPTLGLGLLCARGRKFLVLALPGVAFSMVANFPEMWVWFNYYATLPTVATLLAAAACLPAIARRVPPRAVHAGLITMWIAALWFPRHELALTVRRALREPWRTADALAWVPADARVIASPSAAVFLLDRPLVRLWWAAQQTSVPAFDFMIWSEDGVETPSPLLLRHSRPCHPQPRWVIRCPRLQN